MAYNDKDILEGLRQQEKREAAFRKLVEQYQQRLYWHIRKIVINHEDTDDVLQNTFVKAWSGMERFREDSGLYTWLYRIATNEALSFLKQKQRKSFIPMDNVSDYLVQTLHADNHFSGDEAQKKFQEAIAKLPEKQRLVFNMKYFDEIKYQDMSKILETSEGALKASYHHAVKKIEGYIKNDH